MVRNSKRIESLQGLSPLEFAALSKRGFIRIPDVLPLMQSCGKVSACRGLWWARTTTTWIPWSDSRAWWVTHVDLLSLPDAQGCSRHLRVLPTMPNRQTKESVFWSSSGAVLFANRDSSPGCFGGRSIRCLMTPP